MAFEFAIEDCKEATSFWRDDDEAPPSFENDSGEAARLLAKAAYSPIVALNRDCNALPEMPSLAANIASAVMGVLELLKDPEKSALSPEPAPVLLPIPEPPDDALRSEGVNSVLDSYGSQSR